MTRRFPISASLFLAPLFLSGAACHADPAAEAAYARLNNRLLSVKSATGTLDLTQPGRQTTYAFRLLRPNYSSTVSEKYESHGDGKKEWFYMRKTRQYEVADAGKEMSPGAPLYGFDTLVDGRVPRDYSVGKLSVAAFGGKRCQVIPLTPKKHQTRKLRLYIDPASGLPVGWQQDDPGPDPKGPAMRKTGIYRNVRLNVPLQPRMFAWKPPAGARKSDPSLSNLLKVGTVAPRFTLKTPEGQSVDLASVVKRNKATLVSFWFYG